MESKAVVTNIQKFSVHDGPGIRSIVFLKGCTLRCLWCANPENISPAPNLTVYAAKCIGCGRCAESCGSGAIRNGGGAETLRRLCKSCGECSKICPTGARSISGKMMSADEVKASVDRDIQFYRNSGGGVTFSGGEPMLCPDFIAEIACAYKSLSLTSAVETCGAVPYENFEKVSPYIDLFLFDLKFIDCAKHEKYCGRGNVQIISNLKRLCKTNRVIIRIPIIPGINDTENDLEAMGKFLSEINDDIDSVHCLPYHNFGTAKYDALGIEYALPHVPIPTAEYMENIKLVLKLHGSDIEIGG